MTGSQRGSEDGDPLGRRLARHRANLLAEAGRVARALEVLLNRAQFDSANCREIIGRVADQERIELMRSHGRIEPRARFKQGSGHHPLHTGWPVNALFLDESGKSFPEPAGPQYFALAGVALKDEDVAGYLVAADSLKQEFFGRTDVTFHEPLMRNHDGKFGFGGDTAKQADFDAALDALIVGTPLVAFGVGVRKAAVGSYFEQAGLDPYLPTDAYALAIILILERYVDFLAMTSERRLGRVTLESQGPKENAFHQLEYARALLDDSQWVSGSAFQSWLEPGLRFVVKHGSDPTELADMLVRDVYEWIRSECTVAPRRWDLFAKKLYCRGDGLMGKFGLKIFPDSDIRELIAAHRITCGAVAAAD